MIHNHDPHGGTKSYFVSTIKKGHKTSNCINLHQKVQDLIDNCDIVVDGHNKNLDHKDFKEPFPQYKKGENSKQKPNNKVNYTYSNNDDEIVHMVELVGVE